MNANDSMKANGSMKANDSLNKTDLGQVSIPVLNQYLQLAVEYNFDIESLLASYAISPQLLSDNNQKISGEIFQPLLASLINLSEDELFGLHTAKYVEPNSYSVLGYISMNCQTLGEAISKIQTFEKLVGDMGHTSFEQEGDYFKISWSCVYQNPLVSRHMIDNCLASWLNFAHYLANKKTAPLKVYFKRNTPPKTQQLEYEKLFDCPVLFKQKTNSIFFEKRLLNYPLKRANKQLLTTLESHANQQLESLNSQKDIVVYTQHLISQKLSTGLYHQQDIANLMGISAKTLQRKLKAQSTQFQFLLDKVRLEIAVKNLKGSSKKLENISQQLGFSEPRSFYRWFNKLKGKTPGQYRSAEV